MSELEQMRLFPTKLLSLTPQSKMEYFEQKIIAHQKLDAQRAELAAAINQPCGCSIILVIGPTGVGKTTLLQRMVKDINDYGTNHDDTDPGSIRVSGIEAIAVDTLNFDWKDFYRRSLIVLEEPLVSKKMRFHKTTETDANLLKGSYSRAELRDAFETTLVKRKTRVFWIDEAQHLTMVAGAKHLRRQIETIKSIASVSNTLMVLFGTYDLVSLVSVTGQLDRRSDIIEFPRYQIEDPNDLRAFQSILMNFQKHLPLFTEPDLVQHSTYFYEGSLGCVGMLKTWLSQGLDAALRDNEQQPFFTYCQATRASSKRLLTRAREIVEGERSLNDNDDKEQENLETLRHLLKPNANDKRNNYQRPSQSRSSRSVGRRKPFRDQTGNGQSGISDLP